MGAFSASSYLVFFGPCIFIVCCRLCKVNIGNWALREILQYHLLRDSKHLWWGLIPTTPYKSRKESTSPESLLNVRIYWTFGQNHSCLPVNECLSLLSSPKKSMFLFCIFKKVILINDSKGLISFSTTSFLLHSHFLSWADAVAKHNGNLNKNTNNIYEHAMTKHNFVLWTCILDPFPFWAALHSQWCNRAVCAKTNV